MNPEDIRKLLGGYATGTLTPEEQQVLFEAALGDQELFDALVREQPLRDLLRDPAAKAQLLAALDERPPRWYELWKGWRAAAAIGMAALSVAAVVIVWQYRAPRPLEMALMKAPVPPAAVTPEPPAAVTKAPAAAVKLEPRAAVTPGPSTAVATAPRAVVEKSKAATRPFTPPRPDLRRDAPAQPAELPPAPKAGMAPPPVPRLEAAPPAAPLAAPLVAPPAAPPRVGGAVGGFLPDSGQNARGLFYGNMPATQFVATDAVGQAGQQQMPSQQEQQKQNLRQQAGSLGARAAVAKKASNLGVRYTVLRKSETGAYVETGPDNLKAGDSVELRFETNDSGTLSVMARGAASGPRAWRTVVSRRMERLAPYTTEPLRPGETELQVSFSRQEQALFQNTALEKDSSNLTEQAAAERATYVVNVASPEIHFAITLSFK